MHARFALLLCADITGDVKTGAPAQVRCTCRYAFLVCWTSSYHHHHHVSDSIVVVFRAAPPGSRAVGQLFRPYRARTERQAEASHRYVCAQRLPADHCMVGCHCSMALPLWSDFAREEPRITCESMTHA